MIRTCKSRFIKNYLFYRIGIVPALIVFLAPEITVFLLVFISFKINHNPLIILLLFLCIAVFTQLLFVLALRNATYLLSLAFFVISVYCDYTYSQKISDIYDYIFFCYEKNNIDAVINFARMFLKNNDVIVINVFDNKYDIYNKIIFDDKRVIENLLKSKANVSEAGLNPKLIYYDNGMSFYTPMFNREVGAANCHLSRTNEEWAYTCPGTIESPTDFYTIKKITEHYYWLKLYVSG